MTEKVFAWESGLLGIAAAIAFGMAIYLLWKNKTAPASVSGALSFLAIIMAHFSQIDSVGALSVYVKLNSKVTEANALLTKLQNIEAINAETSFGLAAWSNRLGGMPDKYKQHMLDKLLTQLDEIGIPADEKRVIAQPHLDLIAWDFAVIFVQVVRSEMATRLGTVKDNPSLSELFQQFEKKTRGTDVENSIPFTKGSLKVFLRERVPKGFFEEIEEKQLL